MLSTRKLLREVLALIVGGDLVVGSQASEHYRSPSRQLLRELASRVGGVKLAAGVYDKLAPPKCAEADKRVDKSVGYRRTSGPQLQFGGSAWRVYRFPRTPGC